MKPFENIRVLDLTHVFAGPFATYQLAVLGAEVIKIEPPQNPDMMREEGSDPQLNERGMGICFQIQSANKKSLALDLKSPTGKADFLELVKTADVMVQNYSGKKLEALGLGYEDISSINPNIIYCQMTGYGRTGPKAEHPAYDLVIQAFSGLMAANGTPESGPVRVGPAVVDYGTGAQAAFAIASALFQRTQTGKGQYIDVSMLDSALMLMSSHVTETIATGVAPAPFGNIHPQFAGYSAFEASDATVVIGAWTTSQLHNLFKTVGLNERADELLQNTREDSINRVSSDYALLSAEILKNTADYWEKSLNEAGVPAARLRTIDEALESEQVKSRRVIQPSQAEIGSGLLGRLPVAGFSFAEDGPEISSPPPELNIKSGD